MRRGLLPTLLAAGVVALGAVGCGGDEPLAPEVPGPPADVRIPESADAPGGDTTSGDSAQDGDTTTDEAPATDSTGTDTTGDTGAAAPSGDTTTPDATGDTSAAVPEEGGGAAAPEAAPDSPTNDTAPPAGSEPEQFEDFCAQNPGAC